MNYTVTTTEIIAAVGSQVNLTTPTVTLTITPEFGYTVDAADFSIGDAPAAEVQSAIFSNSGDNVICVVTFSPTFIMPASDVSLPIDIDGVARSNDFSIAGTYNVVTTNTNLSTSTNNAYSDTGDAGTSETLFTLTFTADSTYFFNDDPYYVLSEGMADDYNITRTDTLDVDLNLIQVVYTVQYTYPAHNVTGDFIQFFAEAEEIFVDPGALYYAHSSSNDFLANSNGEYTVDLAATEFPVLIYGTPTAEVTITMDDFDSPGSPSVEVNAQPLLNNTAGYTKFFISLPLVTADENTSLTLSGDIDPSYVQTNPIKIIRTTVVGEPIGGIGNPI